MHTGGGETAMTSDKSLNLTLLLTSETFVFPASQKILSQIRWHCDTHYTDHQGNIFSMCYTSKNYVGCCLLPVYLPVGQDTGLPIP